MSVPDICPICGQSGAVSKVSAVYIAGLQARKSGRSIDEEPPAAAAPVNVRGIAAEALPGLSRRLAPPASRKEVQMRLIHPDLVVLVFSVVAPVFLLGIYNHQRVFFYPVFIGLAAIYGVYFWQRHRILKRFNRQLASERQKQDRIHRGIRRWMNLYYCAVDDVIFEPGGAEPMPADQMHGYLFHENKA